MKNRVKNYCSRNHGGGSTSICESYSMIIVAFCSFGTVDLSNGRDHWDTEPVLYVRKQSQSYAYDETAVQPVTSTGQIGIGFC